MVQNCCVVNCSNRAFKGSPYSFHSFPKKDPSRMRLWLNRISRELPGGKQWKPTSNDKVCSAHFLPSDFNVGIGYKTLNPSAIPSVFPSYPPHKQCQPTVRRPSPKKRMHVSTSLSLPDAMDQPPAKQYFTDHNYCCTSIEVDLEKTKAKLQEVKQRLQEKTKFVKNLDAKLKRREYRISSLLEEIKKLKLLQEEEILLLKETFGENTFSLIENELEASKSNGHTYSEQLISFAVTLHFYSASTYNFVRKYLHLPHPDTIRRWASSHNTEPGFLTGVVNHLKAQLEQDSNMKDVAIMFDSMSIRKQVVYDTSKQAYVGHVNYGQDIATAPDTLALEALVFLVVGLKKCFNLPLAYFFIDKISAAQQAQLVKDSVVFLSETGFDVHAVVCDGAYANQSTANHLGCNISSTDLKTTFQHPSDPNKEVSFIFDAAHLIKNVRNCLADLKIIKSSTGQLIKWDYVVKLHEVQASNTLYLGNKLRGRHIDHSRNKMNVRLAAETLNASVADAIDCLREDMGLEEFAGSEETCTFIRNFDTIFDIANSRNCLGKGNKSPFNITNLTSKSNKIEDSCSYISGLPDIEGKPLVVGRRKTGFLGFIVTLFSVLTVANKLLRKPDFNFFLTYRLSQDHLETFFSKIRRRGGCNNNPNALQFQWAIRALLQKNGIESSERANCVELPIINKSLFEEPAPLLAQTNPLPSNAANVPNEPDSKLVGMLMKPGLYHQHVLHYIAGFIVRKIQSTISCNVCHQFLQDSCKSHPDAALTTRKNNGGLIFASHDILNVVKAADRCLRRMLVTAKEGPLKSVSALTTKLVTQEVIEFMGNSAFSQLHEHCLHQHFETEDTHVSQLIKEICKVFCSIILKHHAQLYNERFVLLNQGSSRHKLSKTIHFLHL